MNIATMHIGIDLSLQAINSNVFGKLQHEEKDYWLNNTTEELIRAVILNEKNTVFNLLTYDDIRQYYEALQVYIRNLQLGLVDELGEGYVYGELPSNIETGQLISGILHHGIKYKVIVDGATDLSSFGYKVTPIIGETFVCDIDTQTGSTIGLTTGRKYRIVNPGNASFTSKGAHSNNPGTEFISSTTENITPVTNCVLQNLTLTPGWDGFTKLIPVYNMGYYINISNNSYVTYGNVISAAPLEVGKKYIVNTVGSTDLTGYGAEIASPTIGYIFNCDSVTGDAFSGGTLLYEIKDIGNRLVKMQDVKPMQANSFGTMKTSPISVYANNTLRVYYDNKFDIERINIDYIIKPISVDYNDSIDSDLPESLHYLIVDLTARRIAAVSGNPNYPAIVNETKQDKE